MFSFRCDRRLRTIASTSGVIVPIRTSSSAVKNRVWNLRIVSVVPPRLHGGKTAATREPSGRRESRIGFSSETSSPSARAMFLTATFRLRSSTLHAVRPRARARARSTKTRREPLTMISVTSGSSIRCAIGRRNGRMTSKLIHSAPFAAWSK